MTNTFKVAIINQTKIANPGGAENWIITVAKELYKLGIEVVVISPYDKKIDDNKLEFITEITYHSLLYSLLKKISLYNFFYIFVYPNKKIDIEKYDLVYTISFYHSLILLGRNKKTIIGTHDFFISNKKFGIDSLLFPIKLLTKLLVHKKNAYIHSLSEIQTHFLSNNYSKIYEIGNNFMAKSIVPVYNDDFTVCFIGKLEKRKGVDILMRIASQLTNNKKIHLYIVGGGEEKYLEFFRSLNSNNIIYIGYASESKKIEILSKSHVMLILSQREAFPIVAVEGLSAGLSIISTWKPLSEIQKGYPIFYTTEDAEQIVNRINQIQEKWRENKDAFYDEMKIRAKKFCAEAQIDYIKLINMIYSKR